MAIIDIQDSNMTSEKSAISSLSNTVSQNISTMNALITALEGVWKDSKGNDYRTDMKASFTKLSTYNDEANTKSQKYLQQIINDLNIYVEE